MSLRPSVQRITQHSWRGFCRGTEVTLTFDENAYVGGGAFLLAKVDADENMRIAGQHKVRGFPTVIAYSRGQEVDRFHSAQTEGFLRRFIDGIVATHAAAPVPAGHVPEAPAHGA